MTSWLSLRVARKTAEADGICSVEFVREDEGGLPAFTAGAHVDVELGSLVRQYSLCNDPAERHRYVIGVLLEPASRGGSQAVHDDLAVGHVVRVSEPRNHFGLVHTSGRSVLIAGGIGVTPLLAMAEQLHAENAVFVLHYCVRSERCLAFRDRLGSLPFANRVQVHNDEGAAGQRFNLRNALIARGVADHLYVCGPGGFIDLVLAQACLDGWADDHLHREYFTPTPPLPQPVCDSFEVRLARTDRVIQVPPAKTIAEVLIENGVEVSLSCEQGVCGTCLLTVLDGVPDHRDCVMTSAEQATNKQIAICVSRSRSSVLVLDC